MDDQLRKLADQAVSYLLTWLEPGKGPSTQFIRDVICILVRELQYDPADWQQVHVKLASLLSPNGPDYPGGEYQYTLRQSLFEGAVETLGRGRAVTPAEREHELRRFFLMVAQCAARQECGLTAAPPQPSEDDLW